jgi:hypothetical protein
MLRVSGTKSARNGNGSESGDFLELCLPQLPLSLHPFAWRHRTLSPDTLPYSLGMAGLPNFSTGTQIDFGTSLAWHSMSFFGFFSSYRLSQAS